MVRRKENAFEQYLFQESEELTRFSYQFVQKSSMEGVTAGGNIRCLLKLAGTAYWPDLRGKILILEALGGKREQLITYLSQLKQLGAFEQAAGILLGTYHHGEGRKCRSSLPAGPALCRVRDARGEDPGGWARGGLEGGGDGEVYGAGRVSAFGRMISRQR